MSQQNLEAIWVKILRALREDKNFSLFGLLSNMDDVKFQDTQIILYSHNDGEKNMLKQNLPKLQNLAGQDVELVLRDATVLVADEHEEYVTRLKEIFGDKVEIV